ncbi:hypothetical protein [Nocardia gipuzkoensis]|uniref:hypothetical protein n=1 Tax=Nocardia gipuzkoensis TaxID=2749991 RepID=UPI003EE30BC1
MTTVLRPPPVVTADLVESSEPAPESLRPWLAELGRIPTVVDLTEPFAHVPQTSTTIVLRAEHDGPRDAFVVGPHTKAIYSRANKPAGCVRLRLAPGAIRSLLGVPAADLTDRIVRLADLPGPAAHLATELVELEPDEVVPYLEDELPRRAADNPAQRAHRRLLATAVAAIAEDPVPISELAARLAVSEGSAIVAPARATDTSRRNSSANSRTSSGRSGLIRNDHRPERGCPTIGPSGPPRLCMCAFTACPSRAGIVIAHTHPARTTIRPVPGGSTTAGRSHTRR